MSGKAVKWAKDLRPPTEPGAEPRDYPKSVKSVLVWLADAAKSHPIPGGVGEAEQCWPEQSTIKKWSGQSIPTIQRALRQLNVDGHVLSKFTHGSGGRRKHSRFFLNVCKESPEVFAKRCGIKWRAAPFPTHRGDGKENGALPITVMAPTHHSDGASLNRQGNHKERERARRSQIQRTVLAANWEPPAELIGKMQATFDVSTDVLHSLGLRFRNYYVLERPGAKIADWPAKFESWCHREAARETWPRKAGNSIRRRDDIDDDAWTGHVNFWRTNGHWNPQLGPEPDQPGCRAPRHVLETLGGTQAQRAA